jgi:hypothetical protein
MAPASPNASITAVCCFVGRTGTPVHRALLRLASESGVVLMAPTSFRNLAGSALTRSLAFAAGTVFELRRLTLISSIRRTTTVVREQLNHDPRILSAEGD